MFKDGNDIDFEIESGRISSKRAYFELLDFVEQNNMTDKESLNYVKELVDLDNFFHYVAYQIYYANTDSFSNNMMIWRKDTDYIKDASKDMMVDGDGCYLT